MTRNEYAHCRLSLAEFGALHLLAAQLEMTISQTLRALVIEAATRQGLWPKAELLGPRESGGTDEF